MEIHTPAELAAKTRIGTKIEPGMTFVIAEIEFTITTYGDMVKFRTPDGETYYSGGLAIIDFARRLSHFPELLPMQVTAATSTSARGRNYLVLI